MGFFFFCLFFVTLPLFALYFHQKSYNQSDMVISMLHTHDFIFVICVSVCLCLAWIYNRGKSSLPGW